MSKRIQGRIVITNPRGPGTEAEGQDQEDFFFPGTHEYNRWVKKLLSGAVTYDEFMDKFPTAPAGRLR